MENLNIKQLEEMLKVLHPNYSKAQRRILAKEVYADLHKPQLTIDYKGKQFTVTKHTNEITIIDGVKFSPIAMDIFDCCLGHLINANNMPNYRKMNVDVNQLEERYQLMFQWLEEKNPQYINVLNKHYKNK